MNERYKRYKIREARFFLARMEESLRDREAFRYYFSAFLTAARSVTQYAREESRSMGREQWYDETVAGNDVLSNRSQTTVRHRFDDWPGSEDRIGSPKRNSEDQIGSPKRYTEDMIGSSQRYIDELEKFVQRGIKEGILSG